ncbi:hypothetical protein JTB14_028862 [Gonioctena quinquepunctata]|nr:hypothetical protein JTB14_028862 [Gonioctena quinquepunctata]
MVLLGMTRQSIISKPMKQKSQKKLNKEISLTIDIIGDCERTITTMDSDNFHPEQIEYEIEHVDTEYRRILENSKRIRPNQYVTRNYVHCEFNFDCSTQYIFDDNEQKCIPILIITLDRTMTNLLLSK